MGAALKHLASSPPMTGMPSLHENGDGMPLKYSNSPSINDSMFAKSVIAFAISSIFATGEVGMQYEPWDLSTLYKDSSGTTPATVNDVVGLMLDKSKGLVLGSNLITNGTFDTDTTGWTANQEITQSVEAGRLKLVAGTFISGFSSRQTVPVTAGKFYKVTATIESAAGNSAVRARVRLNNTAGNDLFADSAGIAVTKSKIVLATGSTMFVDCGVASSAAWGATGDIAYFDNITFEELAGNHAFQTVTASKPILRQDANGFYYLEHDGLDDQLTTGNVFAIQNDSFMALAYAYNAAASSSPFSVFGVFKDPTNYMSLYQRPASAHIFSAVIRGASFGLAPVTRAGTTGSSAPNTPLVTHARLNTDIIYVGKNHDAEISAPFALGANNLTAAPLRINAGLAIDLRFYGGLYRQKDLTPTERANVISYFAQHAGVTI